LPRPGISAFYQTSVREGHPVVTGHRTSLTAAAPISWFPGFSQKEPEIRSGSPGLVPSSRYPFRNQNPEIAASSISLTGAARTGRCPAGPP
jgi:hypothetical protein